MADREFCDVISGRCSLGRKKSCCCTNHAHLSHLRTEANAGLLFAEESEPASLYYTGLRKHKNTPSKSSPVTQARLRNSARSIKELRAEPLGNLNKGYTVRTSRGLPFDASYACTSMHEFGCHLFLTNQSRTFPTQRTSKSLTQPGGGSFWAYSPYLPLERESKRVAETKHKRSKRACAHTYVLISATKREGVL